jgi:FMN reductase
MTRRIAVISAGLSQPSSTRLLADRLAAATTAKVDGAETGPAETQVFDLRDYAHDVTNNLLTGFASPKLQELIDAVTGADGLIAVTPVYTTSYSGLFKSFIDVFDPQALADLPVLIAATGGTERHSLVLDYAMRPLFSYLHAVVVPTGVYAASSDWGSADGALAERIERAASELAPLVERSDRSRRIVDPFALPVGFSPVGAFGAQ